MRLTRELLLLGVGLILTGNGLQPASAQTNTNPPTASGIGTNRPAPPRLSVRDGFRMELVADASLVESPAAMAFDEHGRLYVSELRDFPASREGDPLPGRVRLLEDSDGDGVFDTSVIFADGLERPSGIACSRGGVFVAGPSKLSFLLDQDGDDIADLNRTLLTFNESSPPNRPKEFLRAMTWGPDRRVYLALPSADGSVLNPNVPGQPALDLLGGGGFSFDPLTLQLRTETGSGVTGQTFDDAGHRFVCSTSAALGVAMLDAAEVLRNPFAPNPPTTATLVQVGHLATPLNCLIYRGHRYPTNLHQQAFLVDPAAGAIHLVKLRKGGTHPAAEERDGRFLQPLVTADGSSFRPMQLAVGPNDLLYIADLGLNHYPGDGSSSSSTDNASPTAQGRIWRLVPATPSKPEDSGDPLLFSEEVNLVGALGSSNFWVRDTAARLLAEQRATNSASALRNVLAYSKSPMARLEALRVLEAAGVATPRDLNQGMGDGDASIRAAAVAMAAARVINGRMPDGLWGQVRSRSMDPSPEVRLAAALTLGSVRTPPPGSLLADLYVRDPADAWMRHALLTTRPDSLAVLFTELIRRPTARQSPAGRDLLLVLAESIGLGGSLRDVSVCLGTLRDVDAPADISFPMVAALAEGLDGRGLRLSEADEAGHWLAIANTAQTFAVDGSEVQIRSEAATVLGACVGPEFVADEYLLLMFAPGLPVPMQIPVIQALARQGLDRDFQALTQRWHLWDPPEQLATLNVLLETEDGATALLSAVGDGTIPAAALTSAHLNLLRGYPTESIRTRARRTFGAAAPDRSGLVTDFLGALDIQGSIPRGRELFVARCTYCHWQSEASFGPTLARLRALSPLERLTAIVDPSGEAAPSHQTTVLRLSNGRLVWGVTEDPNRGVIHLRTPQGTRRYRQSAVSFIDRPDWSLMPDNTAAGLTLTDLADLLGYIEDGGVRSRSNSPLDGQPN